MQTTQSGIAIRFVAAGGTALEARNIVQWVDNSDLVFCKSLNRLVKRIGHGLTVLSPKPAVSAQAAQFTCPEAGSDGPTRSHNPNLEGAAHKVFVSLFIPGLYLKRARWICAH